jgi:protein translocase SEC61 complex gamma subunit
MGEGILYLIKKSIFVLKRAENPDDDEVRRVARITAAFMFMLGALGLIISIIVNLI